MNPHPLAFPHLIEMYNKHPKFYYAYLKDWGVTRSEARQIRQIMQNWISETGYEIKLKRK